MNWRAKFSLLLFRLRLRPALSREIVRAIPIIETNEPLVDLVVSSRIRLMPASESSSMKLRSGAVDRLNLAAQKLPPGKNLLVVDAYRSESYQNDRWISRLAEVSAKNPDLSKDQIELVARRFTAVPGGSSGHRAGAAVDLTLCDDAGNPLELGGVIKDASIYALTNCKGISEESRANRDLLVGVMQSAGFVNYPMEWWHFSFGDQLWAAYCGRKFAIYGAI